MRNVIIVGGGISGLAAAWELQQLGVPFTLFEASDRLGGIVRTDYVGEFVIDAGPDAMLARKTAGVDLCRELRIWSPRWSTVEQRLALLRPEGP